MLYEHYTHRDPDLAPRWCITYMASQLELGILSQRWIRPSTLNLNYFSPDRAAIGSPEPQQKREVGQVHLTQTRKEASMTRYPYSLMVLVLSIFFLGAGYQTATGETLKENAIDTKITTSVKSHLATNDKLKTLTQISVRTVDKTVYLTGAVPTLQEKSLAEEVASKVEHVQKVVNNIEVKPTTDK